MRFETRATISKLGFRDLLFTLDMQFGEHDKQRDMVLSTRETRAIAHGSVPATDPVKFTVYLPPVSDAPDPLTKRIGLNSKRDVGDKPARFLDLATGKFSTDQPSDLKLELSPAINGDFSNRRFRITGMGGVKLLFVHSEANFDDQLSPYDQVFRMAPETGYRDEIVLEGKDYKSTTLIYIRSANRRLHARLNLEALGDITGQLARYYGELFVNLGGSRRLE